MPKTATYHIQAAPELVRKSQFHKHAARASESSHGKTRSRRACIGKVAGTVFEPLQERVTKWRRETRGELRPVKPQDKAKSLDEFRDE